MRGVPHVLTQILTVLLLVVGSLSEYVILRDNGPVVLGANLTIQATVYTDDHEIASGKFTYTWEDDALPRHSFTESSESPRAEWNVSYPSPQYYPSTYVIQVKVDVKPHWYSDWRRCSNRALVIITDLLKGDLHMHQNATPVDDNSFVSSKTPVTFEIELHQPDMDYLRNNATDISSYWFIDCHYYGVMPGLAFNNTFKDVGKDNVMDVVVVASFDQPVPVPTTTTTTTTTTTPAPPSNTTTSLPTTPSSVVTTTTMKSTVPVAANISLASTNPVSSTTQIPPIGGITGNQTMPLIPPSFVIPYICPNASHIPRDDNRTYGHFHREISVRAPVDNLAYTGTNWIQPGDILDLKVSCNGSGIFSYCAYTETLDYNITGNEKCLTPIAAENCSFPVKHLPSQNMTMVIVVTNVVSKGVLGVKINIYSAQKHGQLSVIIVPVTCSIIAAILIVFGVAYYVQSRARFTVEIADFDFGQTDDLEYKTFGERLKDAVSNAVNRVEILDEENTGTSTNSGVKYDSLQ